MSTSLPTCWYQLSLDFLSFLQCLSTFLISIHNVLVYFIFSLYFFFLFSVFTSSFLRTCLYQHNLAFLIIFNVYHLTFSSYLSNPFLFGSIDQGSLLDFSLIKNFPVVIAFLCLYTIHFLNYFKFMKYNFTQH